MHYIVFSIVYNDYVEFSMMVRRGNRHISRVNDMDILYPWWCKWLITLYFYDVKVVSLFDVTSKPLCCVFDEVYQYGLWFLLYLLGPPPLKQCLSGHSLHSTNSVKVTFS